MGRPESGKERLLKAALQEFSERGYKRTTLEDIAARADVSKGTLYNYFRSKKEIFDQACDYAFKCWDDWACERAEEAEDPLDKLRTLARELYGYLGDHPEIKRLLRREPDLFPVFGPLTYRHGGDLDTVKMLRSILASGIKRGSVRDMDIEGVIQILGAIFRLFVVGYADLDDPERRNLAEAALNIVVDGLKARGD